MYPTVFNSKVRSLVLVHQNSPTFVAETCTEKWCSWYQFVGYISFCHPLRHMVCNRPESDKGFFAGNNCNAGVLQEGWWQKPFSARGLRKETVGYVGDCSALPTRLVSQNVHSFALVKKAFGADDVLAGMYFIVLCLWILHSGKHPKSIER